MSRARKSLTLGRTQKELTTTHHALSAIVVVVGVSVVVGRKKRRYTERLEGTDNGNRVRAAKFSRPRQKSSFRSDKTTLLQVPLNDDILDGAEHSGHVVRARRTSHMNVQLLLVGTLLELLANEADGLVFV